MSAVTGCCKYFSAIDNSLWRAKGDREGTEGGTVPPAGILCPTVLPLLDRVLVGRGFGAQSSGSVTGWTSELDWF